jgi:uncharacterized repeat protein (TIGR01451 family)
VKSADKTSFSAVDEEITYTVEVENTGNITLTGVNFSDNLSGISTLVKTESNEPEDNILQVGEVWTYTYTYKVTQADLDAGKVDNAASVTTAEITDPVTDEHTVPGRKTPGMTVVKLAEEDKYYHAGDKIQYVVTINNTGNITLTNLKVEDSLVDLTGIAPTGDSNGNNALDVGESWKYTYIYTVTADDELAGYVLNKVTAKADEVPTPVEDEEEVHKPSYTVVKEAAEDKFYAAGDEIHYTVTVTNTGKVAVEGLTVSDTLVPFDQMTLVESVETNETLDVNETWTLTYTYTVTDADVTAGTVLNKVTATDPDDPDTPVEDEEEVHKPSYTVVKEAAEDKFYAAGMRSTTP